SDGLAQLWRPLPLGDVEEERARRVGGVGRVHSAAGEPLQQERIDCPKGQLAGLCGFARAFDVVEQPRDLRGGEIRIEQEPGAICDQWLVAGLSLRGGHVCGAAGLPGDCIFWSAYCPSVPYVHGFALATVCLCLDSS